MALQLHSSDFLHDNGVTYCIRRECMDKDFMIYEKRDSVWIDSGLDKAVKDVNSPKVRCHGLSIKRIVDTDRCVSLTITSLHTAIITAVGLLPTLSHKCGSSQIASVPV